MKKTIYIAPLMNCKHVKLTHVYMAGENSVSYGGTGGSGIAEGKERKDNTEDRDNGWGSLW